MVWLKEMLDSNQVPIQLDHSLFYGLIQDLFYEEWNFYRNIPLNQLPWAEEYSALENLNVSWEKLRSVLEIQFANANKANLEDMKKAISLFLKILFWTNRKPVVLNNLTAELDQLEIKPINIKDRIQYVFKRPESFHAFKQLEEMIIEQKKIYASFQIRMKR